MKPGEGTAPGTWSRRLPVLILIAAVLGLGLRIWAAAVIPIGYDEFWHVFIARNLPREFRSLAHPPLFILLLRGFDAILHSPWSYRAVSLASGGAVVALFGLILRRLGLAPALVVLGAFGAAVAGNLVALSLTVESYMLCAAFVLAAFLFVLDLLQPEGVPHRSRVGFAVCSSLALLSHYAAALFLAAAVAAPFLLLALSGDWRRRILAVWRRRAPADLATLAAPFATGLLLFLALARPWVRALSHLPSFYFDASLETAREFLVRNLGATASLVSLSVPGDRLLAAALPLAAAVVLLLAAGGGGNGTDRLRRLAPAALFALLLLLGMALGLAGKYPFGGHMRHQVLLYLFAPLAGWVALDSLSRVRGRSSRVPAVLLGLAAVAVTAASTVRGIPGQSFGEPPVYAAYERGFGSDPAVHVDQFNLILFFMKFHDWTWDSPEIIAPGLEAYRLHQRGRSRTLIAHRGRWNFEPTDPAIYRDIAAVFPRGGARCQALFAVREPGPGAALGSGWSGDAGRLRTAADEAGLAAVRVEFGTDVALARLCEPEAIAPIVRRVVPGAVRAGAAFQVQPDGSSAISVEGENFRPGSVVVLSSRRLATVYGDPGWITATVPRELTARPARLDLRVDDPVRGPSNTVVFEVTP